VYVVALIGAPVVAFVVGTKAYEASECGGSDGECDLSALAGASWALVALASGVAIVMGVEIVLRYRRRARTRA